MEVIVEVQGPEDINYIPLDVDDQIVDIQGPEL
jgi:hypothetical protein